MALHIHREWSMSFFCWMKYVARKSGGSWQAVDLYKQLSEKIGNVLSQEIVLVSILEGWGGPDPDLRCCYFQPLLVSFTGIWVIHMLYGLITHLGSPAKPRPRFCSGLSHLPSVSSFAWRKHPPRTPPPPAKTEACADKLGEFLNIFPEKRFIFTTRENHANCSFEF